MPCLLVYVHHSLPSHTLLPPLTHPLSLPSHTPSPFTHTPISLHSHTLSPSSTPHVNLPPLSNYTVLPPHSLYRHTSDKYLNINTFFVCKSISESLFSLFDERPKTNYSWTWLIRFQTHAFQSTFNNLKINTNGIKSIQHVQKLCTPINNKQLI